MKTYWKWVVMGVFGLGLAGMTAEEPQPLEIGAAAPDFSLPGVDDKTYSLKDFADAKVLVVIFTCNHCPTAQAYEKRIMKLVEDYTPKGVAFVAISPNDPLALRLDELGYTDLNDSFEEMKRRAGYMKFNFPYLYDGDNQEVSRQYGPVATPHAFVFDAERKLQYRGRIDNNENEDKVTSFDLRNALEAVLAGAPVPIDTTRPFGCSIKWNDKRDSVKEFMEKLAREEVKVQPIDVKGIAELVRNQSENYRLINVWATWCGPCVTELPHLVEIYRMYRHRNVELITISADDPKDGDKVLTFLKKQQASNPNYHYSGTDKDALMDAVDAQWAGAIPHTILVKPGGGIIYRHTGEIDPLEVKRAIVGQIGRTYSR
ncbi:MAG: redoxin domain-containing protein [Candidatus Omnitrophica bacterium]|nr:redoxin domain-containing protein [Candidatus Omnitrophota bacterium]HPP02826.1 redoxin domain-containing protein [bacterium]